MNYETRIRNKKQGRMYNIQFETVLRIENIKLKVNKVNIKHQALK